MTVSTTIFKKRQRSEIVEDAIKTACMPYRLIFTSPVGAVAKCFDEHICVCLCVSLSVSISPEPHASSLLTFVCLWPWLGAAPAG